MIGVDWLVGLLMTAGLPMTASGFDQVQAHVDHLSGKAHAVPTRATDTAAAALRTRRRSSSRRPSAGDGVPDVLVVDQITVADHEPKLTSTLVKEFTRRIGSSLLIGSAYHKSTNARAERVSGVLGDKDKPYLRQWQQGRLERVAALRCLLRHQ